MGSLLKDTLYPLRRGTSLNRMHKILIPWSVIILQSAATEIILVDVKSITVEVIRMKYDQIRRGTLFTQYSIHQILKDSFKRVVDFFHFIQSEEGV